MGRCLFLMGVDYRRMRITEGYLLQKGIHCGKCLLQKGVYYLSIVSSKIGYFLLVSTMEDSTEKSMGLGQ